MKNIIIALALVSALGAGGYYYKSCTAPKEEAKHSHDGGEPHSHSHDHGDHHPH